MVHVPMCWYMKRNSNDIIQVFLCWRSCFCDLAFCHDRTPLVFFIKLVDVIIAHDHVIYSVLSRILGILPCITLLNGLTVTPAKDSITIVQPGKCEHNSSIHLFWSLFCMAVLVVKSLIIGPWSIWMKCFTCNCQTDFSDWWFRHLLWNCLNMNVTGLHWWSVNIGSGNGLVPSGNKPLPEPRSTQFSVAMWRH